MKVERVAAGRVAAKARGKTGGRPKTDPEKLKQAQILYENSDKTAEEVSKIVGIGRRTFFNYLAQHRDAPSMRINFLALKIVPLLREGQARQGSGLLWVLTFCFFFRRL